MLKNEEIENQKLDEELNEEEISNEITTEEVEKEKSDVKLKDESDVQAEEMENISKELDTKKETSAQKEKTEVDEATVIEKIKSFIAKIIAMQEEAKEETSVKENNSGKDSKKDEEVKHEDEKESKVPEYLIEYYDLPYRYNETTVKILAQTPKRLFVYWDVSDNDRDKYIRTFGEDFFYKTYPVLLVYNEDKKYVKEIAINDFANSWYIDIDDPKTKYTIQLGRKFIEKPQIIDMAKVSENNIILRTDYLPFANSNTLEVPNDHVLLESLPNFIIFRNVKTNQEIAVELNKFKDPLGENFDVKEFYEDHYKDEISEGMFDMANPSSNLSSSSFK